MILLEFPSTGRVVQAHEDQYRDIARALYRAAVANRWRCLAGEYLISVDAEAFNVPLDSDRLLRAIAKIAGTEDGWSTILPRGYRPGSIRRDRRWVLATAIPNKTIPPTPGE